MDAAGFAPPDAFGPFRVLHQVGAGTLGPVFRAFDAAHDRLVAVKLFRLDLQPDRMHQLVAECERLIAAELAHPSVAAPIATGTDGIVVYLVQEFVPAESLDVVVRDHGPATPADALRVATQLAGALDFAAVVDIHHGALHPRDVLVSRDETRLTGLGVARAIAKVGVTPPVRRPYTAPERIAGEAWDRRADVFSLAALIHEMLWGRRVTGLGEEAAASLTDLDGGNLKALRAAFARALALEPGDRFDTALDFAASLKAAFPAVAIARPAPAAKKPKAVPPAVEEPRLPLEVPDLAPVATPPLHDDLELHPVQETRAADAEIAPSIAGGEATFEIPTTLRAPQVDPVPAARAPSALLQFERVNEPADDYADAGARIAIWPVAAALVVGVVIGFGGGYMVGGRRETAPAVAQAPPSQPPAPAAAPAAPEGREYTEGAVKDEVRLPVPARRSEAGKADPTPATPPQAPPSGERFAPPNAPGRRGAGTTAPLAVVSRPAGAKVFLDGKPVGTTPLSLPSVAAGPHLVRLERDGYRRWSSSVRVATGKRNRITASLER